MQNNTETKVWNATLYLRLSRDDGDKEESNSITGQRELLRDFIRQIGNPYCYRHGKYVVRVSFADTDISLEDRLEAYIRTKG